MLTLTNLLDDLEVLRRISERGLKLAQNSPLTDGCYIDSFQHLLDEIERMRKHAQL